MGSKNYARGEDNPSYSRVATAYRVLSLGRLLLAILRSLYLCQPENLFGLPKMTVSPLFVNITFGYPELRLHIPGDFRLPRQGPFDLQQTVQTLSERLIDWEKPAFDPQKSRKF